MYADHPCSARTGELENKDRSLLGKLQPPILYPILYFWLPIGSLKRTSAGTVLAALLFIKGFIMGRKILVSVLSILLATSPILASASTMTKMLPEGTRVYFRLDQVVRGKRGKAEVGDIVQCSVWRDVDLQGIALVKAGTRGTCKVEHVKHANIAGIKGKLVIGALDTRTVDGQLLQLTGGYNKDGKSRMALSISLGVLFILPIFITGSAAVLPDGTIFDAYSGPDVPVTLQGEASSLPAISLSGMWEPLTANILLDDFMVANAKPEVFKIHITKQGAFPPRFVIDSVNGKPVEAMPLEIKESNVEDGNVDAIATIKIKTLAKHFQKGINRFEVAYIENGERTAVETILNIQM